MFSDEESLESDSCSLTSWIVMDLLLMTGLVMQKGNLLKGIEKKTIRREGLAEVFYGDN